LVSKNNEHEKQQHFFKQTLKSRVDRRTTGRRTVQNSAG